MKYTKELLQEFKSRCRIEEVAGRYGTLRKVGVSYQMLCPFHEDHHPSLSIHPGRQTYTCFACGAKGDVIAFVQGVERCSFTEALERLGYPQEVNKPGQEGPSLRRSRDTSGKEEGKRTRTAGLTDKKPVLSATGRQKKLEQHQRFLAMLMPYASGHGELSPTYLDFEVRLAPALVPEAYRSFRSRLVFPLRDAAGVLVGFSGRCLQESGRRGGEPAPKYLNSAADGLFDKGRFLYGLHRAQETIRRKGFVFITEGYKDVIAMHAAGYRNTVGLCSNRMTEGQADLLAGMTRQLVLLLDGDPRGQEGALRVCEQQKHRFSIRSLSLCDGEDPDSLFRRLGRDDFRHYLKHLCDFRKQAARRLLGHCVNHPSEARQVSGCLKSDDMEFADEEYRNLLHYIHVWGIAGGIPEEFRVLTAFLRPEPVPEPPADIPAFREELSIDDSMAARTDRLIKEYYEERLLTRLGEHLRQSLAIPVPLFHQIRSVSQELSRPPVVFPSPEVGRKGIANRPDPAYYIL